VRFRKLPGFKKMSFPMTVENTAKKRLAATTPLPSDAVLPWGA